MDGNMFGWIANLLFSICYIPQIYRTYKLKKVKDVSLWQWILQLVGYIAALVFAVSISNLILIIGYSCGLFWTLTFLILYSIYKRKSHVQNSSKSSRLSNKK